MRPAFEWNVKNFSHLQPHPDEENFILCSEPFEAGGVKWRIQLVMPGISKSEHMAMFLCVDDPQSLPVLNGTRSTVRQAWSVRAAVHGLCRRDGDVAQTTSLLYGTTRRTKRRRRGRGTRSVRRSKPSAGAGLGPAGSRSADRAADALGKRTAQPLLQEEGALCWI